jgi:alpha-D-xyloside xylohydrolase
MQLVEGFSMKPKKVAGKLDDTENPYAEYTAKEVQYQYMMGDAILVAPMFAGETSRQVVLPAGKWYDFYTGAFVGDGQVIPVTPGLDRIPLFVRDGGIIPMIGSRNRMPGPDDRPSLEVRHYGSAEASFMLYDDDGLSFDYEKGKYSWSELSVRRQGNRWTGELKIGNKDAFHYAEEVTWRFMTGTGN